MFRELTLSTLSSFTLSASLCNRKRVWYSEVQEITMKAIQTISQRKVNYKNLKGTYLGSKGVEEKHGKYRLWHHCQQFWVQPVYIIALYLFF